MLSMGEGPEKTHEQLLQALRVDALATKGNEKLCDEVVKCCLRQKGFIWERLNWLIPKSHRAMTVSQVIEYLEQVCEKKAA